MDSRKYMISLVVPVYNEEAVLRLSFERMNAVLQQMKCRYEIIYIDDGSSDSTWQIVEELCKKERRVKGLRFARNFGHQLAVTAGMDEAKGDALVIIDADLQDPPELIPQMVAKWLEGYEVVYGKRLKREGETFFKKFTARIYYRVLRSMSAYPIPLDTGDFRLIDRKVADVMGKMREHNRFLRGMSAWAGFRQCPVEYVRQERAAGKTKYTLKKMVKLALDGILGFSSKPILLAFGCGAGVMGLTGLGMIALLVYQIIKGFALMPWMIALLFLLGGGILTAIGVLGAYVARIYDEAQNRPLYILSKKIGGWQENRPQQNRGGKEEDGRPERSERAPGDNPSRRRRRPEGRKEVRPERPETEEKSAGRPQPIRKENATLAFAEEQGEKPEKPAGTEAPEPLRAEETGRTAAQDEQRRQEAEQARREAAAFVEHPSMTGVEQKSELTEKWIAGRAARRAGAPHGAESPKN